MCNKIFYIADTHFGHKNCLDFDERPFSSIEEMEASMIERWNNVVEDDDIVYVLGDFSFRIPMEERDRIYAALHGKKFLIVGNHDNINFSKESRRQGRIVGVADYEEVKDGESVVMLSHYPVLFYNRSKQERAWMLCGHVHYKTEEARRLENFIAATRKEGGLGHIINCGAMCPYMDYTPRTLEELKEYWRKTYDSNC